MSRPITTILLVTSLGLGAPSCVRQAEVPDGPLAINVTFNAAADDDVGSDDEPLPFSENERTFTIDIEVLDRDRTTMTTFDGDVGVRVVPGLLASDLTVAVEGGRAEGVEVTVARAFGPTRFWIEDSERGTSNYAAGVTPAIRFEDPSIAQIQTPFSGDLAPLSGNHVDVRTEDRELLVTWIGPAGFSVTDFADADGSYNAIYVYNYNRPRDLEQGDKLSALQGSVEEYLSFTEMSYPAFVVESSGHTLPDPPVLTLDDICAGGSVLEGYESSVVRVEALRTNFSTDEDCTDYLDYGQWPVRLTAGDCSGTPAELNVDNSYTVPSLRHAECDAGTLPPEQDFAFLQGILVHNYAADPEWILWVRDCDDIPEANRPDDCEADAARARYHYSGSRPTRREFSREIPWWTAYEVEEM